MTRTPCRTGCKDAGGQLLSLRTGLTELSRSLPNLSRPGQMASWRHFLGLVADDLCSDIPVLSWNEVTSLTITKSNFSERSDLHRVDT